MMAAAPVAAGAAAPGYEYANAASMYAPAAVEYAVAAPAVTGFGTTAMAAPAVTGFGTTAMAAAAPTVAYGYGANTGYATSGYATPVAGYAATGYAAPAPTIGGRIL